MIKFSKTLTSIAAASVMMLNQAVAGPYDDFAGTTLVVNFPAHPHYDAVRKILPEFTKETGIEVEVDQLPYLKMRERQTLELAQEEGDYDLIAYVVFSKADYVYADQLENLARYYMNPKLADPAYDADDLIDGYVYNIGFAGGNKGYLQGKTGSLFGIPYGSETSILGYRKDIFEKHGLSVPETYDDMLEIACQIPELEPGMGGLSSRAASGHHASHAFLFHLAPGQIDDPSKSKVVGKVGWAMHPMGTRRGSQTGGFGIGIPKNAEHKDAAFLLMQWLTSKKGDKLVALAGGNPSRFSTHDDADVNAKFPHMKTFGEALQHADPDWRPIIPVWGKINADLGTTLSKVLTEDLDIQEALDGVAERTKAVMEEAGYYTWSN